MMTAKENRCLTEAEAQRRSKPLTTMVTVRVSQTDQDKSVEDGSVYLLILSCMETDVLHL